MAAIINGKCQKCGLQTNDCLTGSGGGHVEIQATKDLCLNGQTVPIGRRLMLSTKVFNSLPFSAFTVTNANV